MKVEFKTDITFFPFCLLKRMNHLLKQNYILNYLSIGHKGCLSWVYNLGQKRSHPVHNDFCNDFIVEVAQADGAKMIEVASSLFFRN